MLNFKNKRGSLNRFCQNEDGNMALTFALSLTMIVGAVGAATDFSALSSANGKAQSIADSTALTAAIYIKDNNRPPTIDEDGNADGYTQGEHTAASLGHDFKSSVKGGADGVTVDINYDDNKKEVTVTVSGRTTPKFAQIFGKDELPFSSESVVSYLETDDSFPASIALVLDNSGSMQFDDLPAVNIRNVTHTYACTQRVRRWVRERNRFGRLVWVRRWVEEPSTCSYTHEHGDKPAGAQIRLDGLKNSVIQFQRDLSSRLETVNTASGRRTIRMGMLPYSSNTIESKRVEMDFGYIDEGRPDPNPFDGRTAGSGILGMIADGGTNSSPPMADARLWMQDEDAFHTQEAKNTNTEDKEALKFVIFMTDGQNTVGNWRFTPGRTGKFWRQLSNGSYTQSGGTIEGTATLLTDQETIAACRGMHAEGVTVFTIGYALEEFGKFRVNGWDNREDDELFEVSRDVQSAAYNLMENCASSPEHFIIAADASKLEAAFDEIQNSIVEELIRIKS